MEADVTTRTAGAGSTGAPGGRVWMERRRTVMGTTAHLGVVVDPATSSEPIGAWARRLLDDAAARLDELEARWSRFLPDSEISRCNAAGGWAEPVHPDTLRLVAELRRGWLTSGRVFDPTVLPVLEALGYDRTFDEVDPIGRPVDPKPAAASGLDGVVLDHRRGTVRLPAGCRIDPGGVGKGLAADLVVSMLMGHVGVDGALVDLGGDIAVAGRPPDDGSGWPIRLVEPAVHPDGVGVSVDLTIERACATTTNRRRRWADGRHHLIDPGTGRPVATGAPWCPSVVTVLAPTAVGAEVASKAIFVTAGRGAGRDTLDRLAIGLGVRALVVTEGDERRLFGHAPVGHIHLAPGTGS